MFKNFAISSIRFLLRNKSYTLMNAAGLSIGLACCLIIFVMYRFENSFDAYHANATRTYWVVMQKTTQEGKQAISRTVYPLGAALRSSITGLEAVTSVHLQEKYQVSFGKNKVEERFAFFVDSSYRKVFDIRWLAGNPESALKEPNAVVVTDEFAKQYFGGQSPIGKTFTIDHKLEVIVRGVVAAPPLNTDHPYRILLPFAALKEFLPPAEVDSWTHTGNGNTYFVLANGATLSHVQSQIDTLQKQYLSPQEASRTRLQFIHLRDMHFRNGDYYPYNYEFPEPVMILLSLIAGLITLISCSNFINLATAQAMRRSKEIGIRKTLGSNRRLIIGQFLTESLAIILLSTLFGLVLAKAALLKINALTSVSEKEALRLNFLQDASIFWFLLLLLPALTCLAGIYPSVVLARFNPVEALKNQVPMGKSRGWSFRKMLILLQFIGSQTLLLLTLIILQQANYLANKPVGFDTRSIIVLTLPEEDKSKAALLRDQLKSMPGILHASFSSAAPFRGTEKVPLQSGDSLLPLQVLAFRVDQNYLSTFGLQIIEGKSFSQASALNEVIVNQTLLRQLGIPHPEQAIGQIIQFKEERVRISGVVKDYSTDALMKTVPPVILQYDPLPSRQLAIKLDPSSQHARVEDIQQAWSQVYGEYLFKPSWVEDALMPNYGLFTILYDMLQVFSCIALLIACLGLYNFASYMIMQRRKEIGVRKILGSSDKQIQVFLLKSLLSPVLLAFLFASPFGFLLGNSALSEFADRIELGVELFLLVLLVILLLAFLAISYSTYRATRINPVEILKKE